LLRVQPARSRSKTGKVSNVGGISRQGTEELVDGPEHPPPPPMHLVLDTVTASMTAAVAAHAAHLASALRGAPYPAT
jgi:hypothetical protein